MAQRAGVKDIEQRLASVLAMSFEDCGTIAARVRLFDAFMPLLERPILRDEAAAQYTKLLQQFKEEIKQIHILFLEGCKGQDEDITVFSNQPPVAKALNWAAGLLQRLREPLQRLEKLGALIGEQPEELKDVCRQCESVGASIEQYQEKLVSLGAANRLRLCEWLLTITAFTTSSSSVLFLTGDSAAQH